MSYTFQIIDERHQQLVRDIDAQRANLDEEKRQLDEDRKRIGVAGAIAGPPPRCRKSYLCQSTLPDMMSASDGGRGGHGKARLLEFYST